MSHGLDMKRRARRAGTGLVWTAVEEGEPIANAKPYGDAAASARRSSRSRTSASPSRTARATRSCSSRGSTPARRSPARGCRSSASTTGCSGPARPAPTASRWRRDAAARRGRLVEVRLRRHRREGRRRRLCRQRLERGHPAVGFRRPVQPERGVAAAARHGVQRPRRLQAGRRGDVQGGASTQRADGIRLLPPARRSSSACATARTVSSTSAR